MIWIECAAVLIVSIIATIALTPLAKHIAKAADAIDYPDKRRVNTKPIPRMGGIAIFGGMVCGCLVIWVGGAAFGWTDPFRSGNDMNVNLPILAAGIIFMFGVGIVDDIVGLKAPIKFVGQIVSAAICASSGLLLSDMQNPFQDGGFIEFGWLAYPITIFYLVAFANVINLIDGLDGLASGISAISAGTIFVFASFAGRFGSALMAVAIVGSCIGFMKSNHHPASIFMGDSGSLLLGLSLGIVSLFAVARSTLFISLLVPIMAAGVPITDTAVGIIRRSRAHQRVDQPDRGHIHHRLLSAGFSQRDTVLIMCLWTLALAICAIMLAESEGIWRVFAIVGAGAITAYAIGKLHLLEPVLRHHYAPRRKPAKRGGSAHEESQSRRLDQGPRNQVSGNTNPRSSNGRARKR